MDGANIEIADEIGQDNMFIFGARANRVPEVRRRGAGQAASQAAGRRQTGRTLRSLQHASQCNVQVSSRSWLTAGPRQARCSIRPPMPTARRALPRSPPRLQLRKERADFKPDDRFLHVVNMIRTGQFGWADCESTRGGGGHP